VSQQSSQTYQAEMAKELADTKEKLKIITQKFTTTRKERDQLKTENKELQDEII
jgi:FtsZ-binding cell division protein ZapB